MGTTDGNIYEVYIETSTEFYRREDKYLKSLQKLNDGVITGLWVDVMKSAQGEMRRVVITTQGRILHLLGKVSRSGAEGGGSIYAKMFESEQPVVYEISTISRSAASGLVVSPDSPGASSPDAMIPDRAFAWLSSQGVFYGKLLTAPATQELGNKVFDDSKLLPMSQLPIAENTSGRKKPAETVDAIALTQWHILHLIGGRVVAINRLDDTVVFDQVVLDPGQHAVGLFADQQKNTFWLFTDREIYEILVRDEDRDVWKVMLRHQHFDAALQYARSPAQKDAVATASGDHLISKKQYLEAASVYGRSSKPFEQVALTFIDHDQQDALRKYLLTKITTLKKGWVMQRIMIASWLVEIFMSKLNTLDDTIITKAELTEDLSPAQSRDQLEAIRTGYHEFVNKYKNDLDRRTTYDIISSHGREEELLYFASAVNDYNYVLSYWVQRERWTSALNVLKRQTDPQIFYNYSSVLISHVADDLVDILMRHPNLKPRNLIPALLTYNSAFSGPLSQNQAVRYLLYAINTLQSTDAAVHNTLISIYASHSSPSEVSLLNYLETQVDTPSYDADFALRLCIENKRIQSCVHIYTTMGQYLQAVTLALQHNSIDLASSIADRPVGNDALRKKLWLLVAKSVIGESNGISAALNFLQRCSGLLRIEDLIPFFPDFVVIDEFKEEICSALESYSSDIDKLKEEMDQSSLTASNIKDEIRELEKRYAVVRPGEKCGVCGLPLLVKQFFVFACQHAFHSECLGRKVVEWGTSGERIKAMRIRELQEKVGRMKGGSRARESAVAELDALVAGDW